jgi:ankyrin repeat protein
MFTFIFLGITQIFHGHHPSSPLEIDRDKDGLCDTCELDIFNTDYRKNDTDGDGIQDGDEDHDDDGISNLEEQEKTTALIKAVDKGDTKGVMALLDDRPYMPIVDEDGMTPLMRAAQKGHIGIIRALLDAGADVNMRDARGRTAIIIAEEDGNKEIIQLLRDAGAKE